MNLTDVEQRLIDHVLDGTLLDLAPETTDAEIDENVMRSWGEPHRIRAEVVRDILRGGYLPDDKADSCALRRSSRLIVDGDLPSAVAITVGP